MPLPWPQMVLIFLIGAAVGSFLNVVIFRFPLGESVVTPRSRCLSCGAALTPIDLFPVLSYLALRGRCRHCGRGFSPRYMLIEFAVGCLALACVVFIGPSVYAVSVFVMSCVLVAIMFIDFDWMIIPDEMVGILAGFGVLLNLLGIARAEVGQLVEFVEKSGLSTMAIKLPASLVGIAAGAGLFLAIGWVSERLLKRPALGGGDVKLAGAMGALLGPGYQFLAFFLYAVFAGALIGLVVMALRRKAGGGYVPFGPMLAASGIAMLLFPGELTQLVMQVYG